MNVKQYREELHQIPELGYQEYQTKAYLKKHLKQLHGVLYEIGETGLAFYFNAKKEKTIAYRSDMDGLPITEKTNVAFSSIHKGKMHACGHDGHMSMLLSFAVYCDTHLLTLPYNVLLLFQPAEESGSGAQVILQSGLLEKYHVQAIYGFHVWPQLEAGHIYTKKEGMLAACSEINITVKGKSSHIANADQGIDALVVGCQVLFKIYELERHLFMHFDHLLKFGKMTGGTIRNVIADRLTLYGSLRSFDPVHHTYMKEQLQQLVEQIAKETKTTIEIHYTEGYPVVYNNPQLVKTIQHTFTKIKELKKPYLQGEDFGQYTKKYPCVFFLLGLGDVPPLHNERFTFDASVLQKGVQMYIDLLTIPIPQALLKKKEGIEHDVSPSV